MKGWRWLAPGFLVLLAVTGWPVGRGIWLSLHSAPLTKPDDRTFVGFDNYVDIVTTREWWFAVATTLAIVLFVVVLQLVIGLAFAVALRRLTVVWPVTRVLVLVPFAMLAVVSAVVWRDAVTTGFLVDWFRLGEVGPFGQLVGVTVGELWRGTGITALILLAGLLRVPSSLLAAAVADGATAWQRSRRVVLPAMAPAIAVAATYRALDTFRILEGPLLVDEPGASWHTAPLLVWDTTFTSLELGLGAAMSMILLLVMLLMTAIMVPLFRVRRIL